jgi:hypothetical protein
VFLCPLVHSSHVIRWSVLSQATDHTALALSLP